MGLFTFGIPVFFHAHRRRRQSISYDPEKAVRPNGRRVTENSPNLDHDSEDDHDHERASQDVLTSHVPHHNIRHLYSHAPRIAFSERTQTITSSEYSFNPPSLYARLKAYIWPSDDQIETFVPNYRWTPILSGIIIHFSILLEIPGLTVRWYIKTENHKTVATQPNPVILDVGLAISLACAVIANVGLVLRFLEKRVQTVTLVCITFLTIHGTHPVLSSQGVRNLVGQTS